MASKEAVAAAALVYVPSSPSFPKIEEQARHFPAHSARRQVGLGGVQRFWCADRRARPRRPRIAAEAAEEEAADNLRARDRNAMHRDRGGRGRQFDTSGRDRQTMP